MLDRNSPLGGGKVVCKGYGILGCNTAYTTGYIVVSDPEDHSHHYELLKTYKSCDTLFAIYLAQDTLVLSDF
jgi:hypothetical protein